MKSSHLVISRPKHWWHNLWTEDWKYLIINKPDTLSVTLSCSQVQSSSPIIVSSSHVQILQQSTNQKRVLYLLTNEKRVFTCRKSLWSAAVSPATAANNRVTTFRPWLYNIWKSEFKIKDDVKHSFIKLYVQWKPLKHTNFTQKILFQTCLRSSILSLKSFCNVIS